MYEIYGTEELWYSVIRPSGSVAKYDKPYTFIDVAESEDITAAFFNRFPGVKTVPQIVLGDDHIGGYNELKNSLTLDQIESIL